MTDHPADAVIDLYQRRGLAWAALRTMQLVEARWLDRFCALLAPGAAILDIGCGAGVPIARDLVDRGFEVTGIDGSATMLALFRRNLPEAEVHIIDMRHMAFDRRFAGMLAWDSFFHLSPDDQRAMFPRFEAHAVSGAPLMFTSGNREGDAVGTLAGERLYHGSLDAAEYRALLDTSGFDVLDHVVDDPTCGNRTIWLARQRG